MEKEKVLSAYLGYTLTLVQPKFLKRYFELKCDNEIIATAINPKWYLSDLEISWNKNKWLIYRPSIWRRAVEIKEVDKTLPITSFAGKLFSSTGTLELPVGQQLNLVFKIFKSGYEIRTMNDEPLVLIKDKISFKDKTEFYIQKRSELLDKYPWVIFLAWFLSQQRKQNSGS